MVLQWSHDVPAVEIAQEAGFPTRTTRSGFNGATTLSPWKHRLTRYAARDQASRNGFNGATTLPPWKLRSPCLRKVAPRRRASMEPRRYRRGNPGVARTTFQPPRLQWSHDVIAVETKRRNPRRCAPMVASMEPRRSRRGNSRSRCASFAGRQLQWSHDVIAVETPASSTCRTTIAPGTFNGATASPPWKYFSLKHPPEQCRSQKFRFTLQWSHDVIAVETPRAAAPLKRDSSLQWSHDVIAVETIDRCITSRCADQCFNGATTSPPWKTTVDCRKRLILRRLQWSHDVIAVEGPEGSADRGRLRLLQWSHDVTAVETSPISTYQLDLRFNFNGATTLSPWKHRSTDGNRGVEC